MPIPQKYRLTLPYIGEENEVALDRWANSILPFGPNMQYLNTTTCAGVSLPVNTPADYDYATSSAANTRFTRTHIKLAPDTDILVMGSMTCFATTAAGVISFSVQLDSTGTIFPMAGLYFNEIQSHKLLSGMTVISPRPTIGPHTYKLRWSTDTTSDASTGTTDYAQFIIMEGFLGQNPQV